MEKNTKQEWFKFEGIGGVSKPIRWQGLACHGIFLLSFFLLARLMIVYDVNSWILTIILAIAILLFLTVAILKSNFREMTNALKMKEQKKQLYIRMGVIFGVLLLLQGIYMIQFDNKMGYIIIILGAILIYIYFKYRKIKVYF
ncbi:hypothetical protein [Methanobacterium spitsbergense]|uniref:Uncharacterized protein n=1 Tax=Methanobacterium spitsbergense TaxID=2874285 RepID=A0A8T5UXM3_9EURY|nr:hypothetical protein [Methanobacterium spitsbergense]MBZ2165920.1 hypothetical protein [Methanobacterium spitsbergense]